MFACDENSDAARILIWISLTYAIKYGALPSDEAFLLWAQSLAEALFGAKFNQLIEYDVSESP